MTNFLPKQNVNRDSLIHLFCNFTHYSFKDQLNYGHENTNQTCVLTRTMFSKFFRPVTLIVFSEKCSPRVARRRIITRNNNKKVKKNLESNNKKHPIGCFFIIILVYFRHRIHRVSIHTYSYQHIAITINIYTQTNQNL